MHNDRKHFETLADQLPICVFINRKRRVIYANRKCEDVTGYRREEFYSPDFDFLTLIAPEYQELMKQNFARHMDGEEVETCEYAIITKDGNRIDALLTTKLIEHEGESAILGTVQDITVRKKAEKALSHERDLIQTIFENHHDFFYFKDSEAKYHRVNKRFGDFFGLSMEDIIGKTDLELFPEEVAQRAYTDDLHVIKTGTPLINKEENAKELNVLTTKIPWFDRDGKIIGLFGISRDITERKKALEQITEQTLLLESIFEDSDIFIFVIDVDESGDLRYSFLSKAFGKLTGLNPKKYIGLKLEEIDDLSPENTEILRAKYTECIATGKTIIYESSVNIDGRDIYWHTTLTPVRNDAGQIYRLIGSAFDITERKKAEETLRRSEKLLKEAQSLGRIGSWELDIESQIFTWSDEMYELYERDSSLGPIVLGEGEKLGYYSAQQLEVMKNNRARAIETGQGLSADVDVMLPSGKQAYFHIIVEPVKDARGRVVKLSGTVQDVTERKIAENEVSLQARMLSAAGESIITIDVQGKVIYWNDSATRIYGWSKSEAIGRSLVELIVPQVSQKEAAEIVDKLSMGERWSGEFVVQHKDGRIFTIEVTDTPVFNQKGELLGIIGVSRDITERKKAERLKDEFLSLVSHELRTPLTVITGSLSVAMEEAASPEDVRELIQNAAESSDILAGILENMLELSRYQSGQLQLNTKRIDIRSLAKQVIDKLKMYGALQRFSVEIPEDLPLVKADPLRIDRIFHNLLENAVKYSPNESEIRINMRVETGFLVTRIIDQGRGIPEEDQERIFQLFSRLDNTGETRGTGLGLVVCKRLVEAHGGWIKVESKSGQGSTFSLGLPVHLKS